MTDQRGLSSTSETKESALVGRDYWNSLKTILITESGAFSVGFPIFLLFLSLSFLELCMHTTRLLSEAKTVSDNTLINYADV